MNASHPLQTGSIDKWIHVPTRRVDAAGATFVYRKLGPATGVPVILLNHWGAVLDNFDPRIVDGIAATRPVIAVNYRGVGASSGKAPLTVAEMAKDAIAVIRALGFHKVDLIGFSLGGNMVLKLAGEYGENPPKEIIALGVISPSVDLDASGNAICQRSNWIYHRNFVRRLKNRIRVKGKLYPELYDTSNLHLIRTITEFDERFTSVAHGFTNATDYYYKASALRVMDQIRIPTLIIHAQDDPFIPFAPLRDPAVGSNPYILLVGPERGGHVAFIAARPSPGSA